MQSNTVVSEGDFIIQLFVTTQFLCIVLRDFTWHYSGASARAPSRAYYRKRKPIPMRENLVMPSAYTRPPRTHWQGEFCLTYDKKLRKICFKDVLLALSHFLKKLTYNCSIPGQIERKHNKLMANTKVGPNFLLGISYQGALVTTTAMTTRTANVF